ncbi:DUF4347 domain-containing protein [Okeania sp. KiyG1]|uniref:DUF4347 domain-containing protein n=1 Tax=Okeania sp. KiyG1 TaxID=2720165 RepID=UPI0019A7B0B6|nr:DUF4347 domain-containing protein [Okeania sp. KiyG1]GGA16075.1 hypothetical protein CYANOKiyG1_30150 [Okeania sp. KiyG1]
MDNLLLIELINTPLKFSTIMNQTKLLFIDSKVENYHNLISEIDLDTKVFILQPNGNGIDQIAENLGKYHLVETIHIISHGAKNTLYLGNSILNLENIHLYAESIQQWGKCLSADGEILIYGCQVASGKEGKEFVRQLHQLTGANIAASETLTGNVSKGGNWNLEVIFGQLKSALAFTSEVRATYAGVLANIVVDTTDDVVDNADGVTSLREAIIEANNTPEDDTIQLTAGETYNLTISGSDEDAAATGDLDIVAGGGEITVISQGGEQAVIDAGGESGIGDRVFHVLEGAALKLDNLEVTRGAITSAPSGGGIFNYSGTVSISNSTISGNSATYGGGGIVNIYGSASISNSTISGNFAFSGGGILNSVDSTASISNSIISGNFANFPNVGSGGGISNDGTAIISDSTISGNSADDDGGGIENLDGTAIINDSTISGNSADNGGGISNLFSGTVSISDSIISGNSANNGGGIYNKLNSTLSISDSTISGNSANNGGGIYNKFYNSAGVTISISNSTISGNSANNGSGIYNLAGTAIISNSTITNNGNPSDSGSAILQKADFRTVYTPDNYYDKSYYASTTITSSIVSGNINSDVESVESNNLFISGGNNLIGTGSAINDFNGNNDQTGITNPLLADLADNGGPTFTHLPLPNSPAIDAGSNPNALTTDQRGEPRFVGEGVDVGAVELQIPLEIIGIPESEVLNGAGENDTITGLAGNDTINGRGGDDQIIGSRGSDFLFGKNGNDTLQGRQGNDFLFGGNGNDSLVGGIGRDRFNGGAGDDTLTGGASIDRFIFNTTDEFNSDDIGVDDITDFVPGQDIILLDKSTFTEITSNSGVGFSINIEFAIVTSDADAETSEAFIVYNSNNGKLFYNANGTDAEFGSGGEFANLTNTASISEDDFLLRG